MLPIEEDDPAGLKLTRMIQAALPVVRFDGVLLAALTANFVGFSFLASVCLGGFVVEKEKPSGQIPAPEVFPTHLEQDAPETRCCGFTDCVFECVALR